MTIATLWLALLVDLFAGDPRWFPHPVRLIGGTALAFERFARSMHAIPLRLAGAIVAVAVVALSAGMALLVVRAASMLHPAAGVAASVLLLYFAIAPRDLADHALAVGRALDRGDLGEARKKVSLMVGRDTVSLDETEVAKAAVESVAENSSDGVTAPLFYGLLFGPAGAWAYKASNTLDSMFGYRNERYLEFGWASARLDDLLNYLPARLTVLAVAVAAFILRLDPGAAIRSVRTCARRHESPNAGYPESAFAGALGVTFGGPRSYGGTVKLLPHIGLVQGAIDPALLVVSVRLMQVTTVVFLAAGSCLLFASRRLLSF